MATQKESSSSNGSPGTTPTPPPASGLQTEEGMVTRPRATSTETPANQAAAFDPDMMEKFFSFMSFYEQHQQGAPAQSNNSNNNIATLMSLDGSSYARGIQQQPTFAPTSGMGLVLGGRARVVLTGHADASWVDDLATQRSSQGYTFSLGSGSVSWRSTRSSSVLSSSCEAEIYAGAMAAQELRWLTYLLTDLGEVPRSPPVLYVNNKAMLALCQEHRLEHRTKHIALRYFLARELQQRGQLRLSYVASQANIADVFTKALQPCDHQPCFAFLDWSCDLLFSPTLPMGMSKVLIAEGLGYNLRSVRQLMAKGIHLKADSTTQEFKLYHGKGVLYIEKAVLKNNVFVLDFLLDLGTADSDGIVAFTSWTHPPDLDPNCSPKGFWYSHTIPETEQTRALATIQHSAAAEPTSAAGETTSAAAETTSAAAETTSAAAETTAAAAATSTPIAGPSTASAPIDDTPPTPAQQLNPTPREVHRSANFTTSFYSNSDLYRRSPGHRVGEDIWHARMGHPSNTVLNNAIRAGVLNKDSLLLTDGSELRRSRGTCFTCPEADLPHWPFASHHNPSAPAYAPLEKVYSDILYNRKPGQGAYSYTITFIDAATRYVWHLNLPSKDIAFEAFVAWLPVAERESGVKLKSFQSDGGGEYTSQRFKQYLAERGIKRLISLPYAHQQQGVAERMNMTLQNTMRKLLRGMRLPNHQWPKAMDHAVMLHNLLSSSSLPNNASPHLLWTGKQGSTKMLRWGLHLGIERNCNAWKIFGVHSKETVAACDVIFYERLTVPTYLANLEEDRDPTGGFRGDRHFASAADEADWDEQNVDEASEEAGPLPYCSVDVPMDDENPRESANTDVFYHFADNGYVTPAEVNTNEAERIGPNFIPDPEAGDEAAYPADTTLPRYTQSGLQILDLVTAVHGTEIPKEPATVQQALGGKHKEKWREAMDKELKALKERTTWKVIPIGVARNKTVLTGKWVFRVKTKADGTIDKFKARWVVCGFNQEHGRDFTETFAPVSRHTSLRILLAIAAMKKKKLRQIDVANAFLYAPVDAEIFVELPHGSHGEPNQVCQLQKSLYGIKQAPRLWQQHLHARLIRIGFRQLPHDQGMYRLTKGTDYILLIVYVDDLLYIGSTNNVTTWFEGELQKDLTLTVSSTVTQYLGLNIQEEEDAIYLNAAKYADTIAKRFALTPTTISTPYRYTAGNNKEGSAPLKPAGIRDYQRKLGCLLFAAVTCRPDLSYSASQLATYLKKPEAEHMAELGRALHYLVSSSTVGLTYHKNGTTTPKLISYVDADHAGDSDNRRSRTGYIYRFEPIGPISWQSSKHELIALSSAEAEYIALCSATKEGLYLRELLEEAKLAQLPSFSLFCDNQSAIRIANKNGFANRTKNITVRYFFAKDEIKKGRLELSYCPTSEMAADYLTKKLGKQKFEYCILLTGQSHVTSNDTPEAKGSVGNN
ncbi:unnamed protein product [Closterium sp. NIES-53]